MFIDKRKLLLVLLLFAAAGCQSQVQREKVDLIANNVVTDVAQVTQTSLGKNGAPILVIEESHISRGIRLEEAIVLNRLYYDHKITQIGLEGSIKERPPIDAEWFSKAAKNQPEATVPVAVNLLREGEINSAEFMELTYSNNIVAVPIETQKEYEIQSSDDNKAYLIYISYLYEFAIRSPRPEHKAKLDKFEIEINKLEGKDTAQKEKLKEAQKYIYSLKPSELSADPWVKETSDKLLNENDNSISSLEEEINFYEGLQKHIETTLGKPNPEDSQVMEAFVGFLRGREAANKTMVEAIAVVADKSDVYAVAMIIGAAHTKGVSRLLKAADRPFAVIRPNSLNLKQDPTILSSEMYKRKLQGSSVYSGDVTDALLKAFPVNTKLPPPVMQQKWFNAKSELYLYTERITQKLFAGGGAGGKPPGGGDIAPNLFAGDDFNGAFIRIDPTKIRVVEDVENSGVWTAVFPAEINPSNPALHKTIWVKAGRSGEGVPSLSEKEPVEKMLKDALFDVKNEKLVDVIPSDKSKGQKIDKSKPAEKPLDQAKTPPTLERGAGRIKITRETTAAFADSEAAVMKKSVVASS